MTRVVPYGPPRKVRVEDGHVLIEALDGTVVVMEPEVAIEMSRLVGNAGAKSLINKVVEDDGASEP
ncbi:MAG: hypothetical protein EOO77_26430 [Oxalobacteraceae bacterium]|nr:MAG: hypothetical protein EOO77_26430 [Oxalobacteraceae bacterium]